MVCPRSLQISIRSRWWQAAKHIRDLGAISFQRLSVLKIESSQSEDSTAIMRIIEAAADTLEELSLAIYAENTLAYAPTDKPCSFPKLRILHLEQIDEYVGEILRASPNLTRLELDLEVSGDDLNTILNGGVPSLKELLVWSLDECDRVDLRSICPALESIVFVEQRHQLPVLLTATSLSRVVINLNTIKILRNRDMDSLGSLGELLQFAGVSKVYLGLRPHDIASLRATRLRSTCDWYIACGLGHMYRYCDGAERARMMDKFKDSLCNLSTMRRGNVTIEDTGNDNWILRRSGLIVPGMDALEEVWRA
ncbi:MAG: hypothetical protein CYPHOPRED_002278 [Cyphobasidiales sp. Tagirdzhanova-0007]|nr:MAG: hypothetical protein CYPHOPRED_002278 [Cyphobasidiales sp. Tagirdzhanova-0007]